MLGALQAPYGQATLCMNLINLAMTSGLLDVDCAVIMAAELEAMTRTVATPALSFFPCYDHLGIFPSYLWLQDHYHLWTSLWLWSDCKSNGPFMVFVLLPLRMAACAKSGTITVWFFFFFVSWCAAGMVGLKMEGCDCIGLYRHAAAWKDQTLGRKLWRNLWSLCFLFRLLLLLYQHWCRGFL